MVCNRLSRRYWLAVVDCKHHGEAGEPRSGYPINTAAEAFGDRWTLIVFRDIVFGDKRYFRELHAVSLEGIASNALADRLKLVGAFVIDPISDNDVRCQRALERTVLSEQRRGAKKNVGRGDAAPPASPRRWSHFLAGALRSLPALRHA